jgi:putative DNA primase/helicase
MQRRAFPDAWRTDVCEGFDHRAVAKLLIERGFLQAENCGRADKQMRLPLIGKTRVYHVANALFDWDGE